MKLNEMNLPDLDIKAKHSWLEFIHLWFSGAYMGKGDRALPKWRNYRKMFPTGLQGDIVLYRLCTVPTKFVKPVMVFNPAVSSCSSWTKTKRGLQFVAGIAREKTPEKKIPITSRIAIQAVIPADLILATPQSVKKGFTLFSEGYFDKYPMVQPKPVKKDGILHYGREQLHPDWPGDKPSQKNGYFDTNEVGFLLDRLSRRGGFYGQNEYVVETPRSMKTKLVKVFREGNKVHDEGWEE